MIDAFISRGCRTPVGKAPKGMLRHVRPDDLAAIVVREAIARVPGLVPSDVEDVILGCAYPEAQQGRNLARTVALRAGLSPEVAGVTVNRLCASGLEAIAIACQRIASGEADVIVAGGVESMSQIPRGGHAPSPNPTLVDEYPGAYLSMGLTAERLARQYQITREDQDLFSLSSHQKAAAATKAGLFAEEIVPVTVDEDIWDGDRPVRRSQPMKSDEGIRGDSSLEKLAKLPPAFHRSGSVTAGNSSQTSDGAAAVVVLSEAVARRLDVRPLSRLAGYRVAGCPPEVMGIGPVAAVPKVLGRLNLSAERLDLIELNEAFACQALAVIRELNLPMDRLNVHGGAIALGHALGSTGARLVVTMQHELARRGGQRGLVTLCVGGGMGAAAVIERVA